MAEVNIGVSTPTGSIAPKRKDPDTSPSPQSVDKSDLKKAKSNNLNIDIETFRTMAANNPDPVPESASDKILLKLEQIEGRLALSATKVDLLSETSKLVTKEQFDQLSSRMSQLESDHLSYMQRLDKLERDNISIKKDIDAKVSGQHVYSNRFVSPPRLNLLIEGLPVMGDPYKLVFELAKILDMDVDRRDFSLIVRMKKRGEGSKQAATILVCFVNMHVHDEMFAKRTKLKNDEKLKKIWLNLDEPEEIRRQKSKMRKLAFQARSIGLDAFYTHNMLCIDGKEYGLSDLDKIVLSKPTDSGSTVNEKSVNPPKPNSTQTTPKPQRPPRNKRSNNTVSATSTPNLIDLATFVNPLPPKIKIAKTKAGYTFSGPSAYMSNFHIVEFVFEGVRYQLVEQGYQFKFAMHHKEFDIAQKILGKTNGYDIKDDVANIVADAEWAYISVPLLRGMMYAKFLQNPELMDKLVATYPHPLIEATRDSKWGGGLPFGAPEYEMGIVKGANVCGKELTSIRDEEYRRRAAARLGQNVSFPNAATSGVEGATAMIT